ncbi:MAG: polyprenyl synthetase family protein [Chloroflexia bacterium]
MPSSNTSTHEPSPTAQPTSGLDMAALIAAVDSELTDTLVRYSGLMPTSLIDIGKFALAAPGKVFAFDPARVQDFDALPRWPLFVLLSCQAASPPGTPNAWRQALPAAVAVEIAMAAADILDELVDDDPSPLVLEYGPGQALNTGNLMLVMAQQALVWSARKRGGPIALAALDALQDMLVQAATGQHLDMLYDRTGPDEVTLEMSAEMTSLKAGALISGACRIGALMAGAEDPVVETIARFGKELGSIAQLTNDVQDVLPRSVEAAFDRKTDLRKRKRTIPIVFTLRDDVPQPNALQRAYAAGPDAPIDEDELRQAVMAAGGIQFTGLILEIHRQHALEALDHLEGLRPGSRAILAPLLGDEPCDPSSTK